MHNNCNTISLSLQIYKDSSEEKLYSKKELLWHKWHCFVSTSISLPSWQYNQHAGSQKETNWFSTGRTSLIFWNHLMCLNYWGEIKTNKHTLIATKQNTPPQETPKQHQNLTNQTNRHKTPTPSKPSPAGLSNEISTILKLNCDYDDVI